MVVGENKCTANIMDGIENTGDVRLHDHRLRLKQRFDIVRKLGQGTYGKVQLGINKKTGQEVAIKTIKKCKIESEADLIRIRREVQIMSSVRHPNIVHIYEVFENSEKMILVMEYCSGGELYDYLSQKKVLQEDEARRLFRQIATAVYYCHIHKICHRDLKLENVLLDDTGSAKIADFGLSNVFKETSLLSTFCGSPLYASPEIVKGTPYIGPEVDCWSLGVLLYTLVYGAMPFDGSNFKRLVRQISNGDYYEPKSPSTASPLIRDMLTVDPLKRADIAYICDHPWVNTGCGASCLEVAEALAAETPVRLDLLLSLAPAAPSNCNSVVVPETPLGPEESCTDLTSSTSMAVEPSNSAEKRILELVAEGGEDAIKPSPTRTIVSASDNKRKLELAMSASGLQRKKERVASTASVAQGPPAVPEESAADSLPTTPPVAAETTQPTLKSSATITIQPAVTELVKDLTKEIVKSPPKEEEVKEKPVKTKVTVKKKTSPKATEEKVVTEKQEVPKQEEAKPTSVAAATDKLTSLSITQSPPTTPAVPTSPPVCTPVVASTPAPTSPAPAPAASPAPPKPKKLSIPGGNVGNFKDQFERRASLTAAPEPKRTVTKPVVSKIAKPKAQSEDRELTAKSSDNGTVRLQQIGIEPSPQSPPEESGAMSGRGSRSAGVQKADSEPSHSSAPLDPGVLLQDARRSLQNSMAKLAEEKAGEENRRRAARDIISSAIRTGKPPVPYGRSSSAGVATLLSPASTAPTTPPTPPPPHPRSRVFRTEAQHRVEDHRPRGVSVERIIPIRVAGEEGPTPPGVRAPAPPATHKPAPAAAPRLAQAPLRRLVSSDSNASEACSSPGEPIKKSAREFIIPIAVEGKGYVTPRQRSLEPEASAASAASLGRMQRTPKPRRISSLVSGGESEEEDDTHMHRLRSSRAARAESVSSGEEDEEDEGFHLLTAENLFSTLLHRVRALTNRLNGEEGPGFPQHPHSLFNNLQSPFFNSPHLPRRHLLRDGWGSRDRDFDSMFGRQSLPRGNIKKSGKHHTRAQHNAEPNVDSGLDLSDLDLSSIQFSEKEMRALSGLTPALSRRLQQQLLAHLPPAAARSLRRTLSLNAPASASAPAAARARTAESVPASPLTEPTDPPSAPRDDSPRIETDAASYDTPASQYCTLPRLKRPSTVPKEATPPSASPEAEAGSRETSQSRGGSVRTTPDRPLLSKYLTPERTLSLDESYSSDGGSILSEPSYVAAYGAPAIGGSTGLGFRRHSMRLAGDQPRKRISRFLRPDFFDTPPDENVYVKHKKEKELETQKILKEIREKKNKYFDSSSTVKSPTENCDAQYTFKDEAVYPRKCLSPISVLTAKERSRSNTPFLPSLDNIKESAIDHSSILLNDTTKPFKDFSEFKQKSRFEENPPSKDSRLARPKSYPVKNLESIEEPIHNLSSECSVNKDNEYKDKNSQKESKLIRPKSYPTSSPSPEKVHINRNIKKQETLNSSPKEEIMSPDIKNDVEVSFSITLPKKTKPEVLVKAGSLKNSETLHQDTDVKTDSHKTQAICENLVLKKYKIIKNDVDKPDVVHKNENGTIVNESTGNDKSIANDDSTVKDNNNSLKKNVKLKSAECETPAEKKGTIKKKIIRKVSSKSKTDVGSNQDSTEAKSSTEKKKVTKKVKEKSSEDGAKPTVTKKKSVLQSIGQKLEKFASNKSASPEKIAENNDGAIKKHVSKESRVQREQSVPVNSEPPTESNLIKRAVTLTDVAALDTQSTNLGKTTVSKVLGLFKKFEPKEKVAKSVEKSQSENLEVNNDINNKIENNFDVVPETLEADKPRRPTSLLLNGLGRKNKYGRTASDSVSVASVDNEDQTVLKKESEPRNLRNTLKLDFSKLPRVKKIVPTNPVIEPQYIPSDDKETNKIDIPEKNSTISQRNPCGDNADDQSRSRSRSRSTISNSELKSDNSADYKTNDKNPTSPSDNVHQSTRNHESITPEKEDIVDRIRRKSFYSRFNEKKQRRKSNLVGPGAAEYDPVARIHSPPTDTKFDASPTSPGTYDLSPAFSVASDISPSTERYRSLLTDLPVSPRSNLRYDSYGLNDKIDTYRSLDRNDFRKYPGSTRSYLDYDQPSSYSTHRYSRTKSLLDSSDGTEDSSLGILRDPHKYNRTISMYSPGNYATYRPKRTRNSAIILKESEKEPSPENILDKIRQRKKISISVTRKPDTEKDSLPRSNIPPKGEGDGSECSEKVD
ncbi:LOW QUALITY PROTEIN: nuak family kinase 1 [Aphomia sociella]